MSGPSLPDVPSDDVKLSPEDFHVAAVLALASRYDVLRIIEHQLRQSYCQTDDPFSVTMHVAAIVLDAPLARECRDWLVQLIEDTPNIQAAAVLTERILRSAGHLGREASNQESVRELELSLTKAATAKHLGQEATPDKFSLRIMGRNLMANEVTRER